MGTVKKVSSQQEIKLFTPGARRHVKRGTKRAIRYSRRREIQSSLIENKLSTVRDSMDALHAQALVENTLFDLQREDPWDDYCHCKLCG